MTASLNVAEMLALKWKRVNLTGEPALLVSWHVFRNTHATLGEQIGMALSDRQAQMGHGDVRMTMHYTHSDMERRRAGVEAMSEKLTAATPGTVN